MKVHVRLPSYQILPDFFLSRVNTKCLGIRKCIWWNTLQPKEEEDRGK